MGSWRWVDRVAWVSDRPFLRFREIWAGEMGDRDYTYPVIVRVFKYDGCDSEFSRIEIIMNEVKIRRFYMEDHEWERTHESWKLLKPNRNFNEFSETDETEDEHYERIQSITPVPFDVVAQWLYPLYYDLNSTNNYGWLDYRRITFKLTYLTVNELTQVNIISEYRSYFEQRSVAKAFSEFQCRPADYEHWHLQHTWRVPPVVINVRSLPSIPAHAEISGPLQLIEGHTRLAYLLATHRYGMNSGKSLHAVYLMESLGT